jgi:hypothetical protein
MSENPFNGKISSDEHERIFSACYQLILSWPDSPEKKTEPAADNLGWEAVAGSNNANPSIHQDLSMFEEMQKPVEGGISQ